MNTTHRSFLRALLGFCGAAALAFALPACGGGGSNGSDGSQGPVGPPGPEGPPGSSPVVLAPYDPAPGINVVVQSLAGASGAGGNFRVGDVMTVKFTVKTDAGDDLDPRTMDFSEIMVSGPTFNYQRVIADQMGFGANCVALGGGLWSFTLPAIPSAYLPPYNDTPSFGSLEGELAGTPLLDGTYSVGLSFTKMYAVEGSDDEVQDGGSTVFDFLFGNAVTLEPRAVVSDANCNACHQSLRLHGGYRRGVRLCVLCHTSGAEDKNLASPNDTPDTSVDFKVMIHKLHNAAHLPSVLGITTNPDGTRNTSATPVPLEYVGYSGVAEDFSDITFPVWPSFNIAMPKDLGYSALSSTDPDNSGPLLAPRTRNDRTRTGVVACLKCHGDPDGPGPLPAPTQGDLYKTQPSRQVCGSCHDDVNWAYPYDNNGAQMPPQPTNNACFACHPTTGSALAIETAHTHPLRDPAVNAGVNAVVTAVTGGSGAGGRFQVGDSPSITFTLKDDAGGDVGLATMDSCTAWFFGPTTNQQEVLPLNSANGMTLNPFDFTGRLQAVSTTNKGTMSKVFLGVPATKETIWVEFTSSTVFNVIGRSSGFLGSGTLPASTSTNPSNGTITNFDIGPGITAGAVTVTFSDATHFTVAGVASGTGVLPAATSASTRFTSPNLSFNLAVGTTAFAAGNAFNLYVFVGASTSTMTADDTALFTPPSTANAVRFAVVAGKTAFSSTAGARDRFYYDVVPNAASYTYAVPMDLVYEFLGDSTNSVGQALTPGNSPVYWGRQQLWEAALSTSTPAPTAGSTKTTVAAAALARFVDVLPVTGFASSDVVVLEPTAGVGTREYVQVTPATATGAAAASGDTTVRLYFRTPLRYAHASNVQVTKVNLTLKQEGAGNAYNLVGDTMTSVVAYSAGVGMVASYRTDGRFGYKRHAGDAFQAYYSPPANDVKYGEDEACWKGKPFVDGTYTADIWFYRNLDLGLNNEVQTYRSTSNAGTKDFLFGASATDVVPHSVITPKETCLSCHDDVLFHGGGRRGVTTCLSCHSISGAATSLLDPTEPIEFRQLLHEVHKGEDFDDSPFPVMPNGVARCDKCHGTNDSWKSPVDRSYPGSTLSARVWGVTCGSCHDSKDAHAHIDSQTSVTGVEACIVCHGDLRDADVVKVHFSH